MKKNHILSSLSLNYFDNGIEKAYRIHSREYTFEILKFMYSYILLALAIILLKSIYFLSWFSIFRTISLGVFIILMVSYVEKYEKTHKFHLEIFFCFFVIFIYTIHLRCFLLSPFEYFSKRHLFYLSAALESFRIFLFISKIKWIYICVTNLVLNFLQYNLILSYHEIESSNIFSIIFTLILMTLPIIAYFQERSFKMLFYQNITFDRSLKLLSGAHHKNSAKSNNNTK